MSRFHGFDHIDARVPSLVAVEAFYDRLLPALGLVHKRHMRVDEGGEWSDVSSGGPYNAAEWYEDAEDGAEPRRFLGIIEDRQTVLTATRIAFRIPSYEDLLHWEERLTLMGACAVERSADVEAYPAIFFEDPGGMKLEICARR